MHPSVHTFRFGRSPLAIYKCLVLLLSLTTALRCRIAFVSLPTLSCCCIRNSSRFFFSSTHFLFYVWLLLHNHNAEVYIFIAMQNFALYLCMFVLLRLLSSSSAFYLFLLPQHFSCARFYYRISFGHLRDRQRGLLHNYITTYILHIY